MLISFLVQPSMASTLAKRDMISSMTIPDSWKLDRKPRSIQDQMAWEEALKDNGKRIMANKEGFIDFLSYLTAKGINKLNNTVIVLNSASFINRVSEFMENNPQMKSIDYFRDRDQAGLESFNKLASNLRSIIIRDKSETYLNHEDLNEWLTNE